MSRQVYTANNKVGQTITFKTNSYSGLTGIPGPNFTPSITMKGGKRVHWDLDEGNGYVADNTLNYIFNDTGRTKTIQIRTQKLSDITNINLLRDSIVGQLDLRGISLEGTFDVRGNPDLTGVTHGYSNSVISPYFATQVNSPSNSTNITGVHDLSMFPNLGGILNMDRNPNLTKIIHTASTQIWTVYDVGECNITGQHDMSMFPNLGGDFRMNQNSNLTGVTHTASTQIFTRYNLSRCNITGQHDMSMFPNLGGVFDMRQNKNLTGITHTYSPEVFTFYRIGAISSPANAADLRGTHDLTMFPNLGGNFGIDNCSNLTSIIHTASTQPFTTYKVDRNDLTGEHDITMLSDVYNNIQFYGNSNLTAFTATPNSGDVNTYYGYDCNITGNHDMSIYPNLGGNFRMNNNSNLTGVTHTASTRVFDTYYLDSCNITGNHDLTMFPNLGGTFRMFSNPNLTGITHTASTQPISYSVGICNITGNHDVSMLDLNNIFHMNTNPNLTGVNFNSTGSTNPVRIQLFDCDLTGNFDVSMFTTLNRKINLHNNPNLTGVTLPITTNDFYNDGSGSQDRESFGFNLTSIKYVDFHPLSGATLNGFDDGFDTTINLGSNGMTAGEVNRMLVELSGITSNNYSGWSGTTLIGVAGNNIVLSIGGTNAAPDSSSGGYNGTAALSYLTGATPTGAGWDVSVTV